MAIQNQKKGNQELNEHGFTREGFSNKKDGVACQKFWKKTVRGAKILFFLNCGRGLNFYPSEAPILKQHIISCHIFFGLIS